MLKDEINKRISIIKKKSKTKKIEMKRIRIKKKIKNNLDFLWKSEIEIKNTINKRTQKRQKKNEDQN
jgi:hypothetical protein